MMRTSTNASQRDGRRRGFLVALLLLGWGGTSFARMPLPLHVVIESFTGHWTGTHAEVVWQTRQQIEVAAFSVYRVNDDGTETALQKEWLYTDLTQPEGEAYSAVDRSRRLGDTARYRLDALHMNGDIRSLGLWEVRFDAIPKRLAEMVQILSEPIMPLDDVPVVPGPALKIPVNTHDLFAVSFADIGAGLGLTVADVENRALAAQLAMRCGDVPVAYRVDTARQRVLFYGWPVRTTYTKTNFFWIEPGEGMHIAREAPVAGTVAVDQSFYASITVETDTAMLLLHDRDRSDMYYWSSFSAASSTGNTRHYPLDLEGYAGGDVTFTVCLVGWSSTSETPDHVAEVSLNGHLLTYHVPEGVAPVAGYEHAAPFDGKADITAVFKAPAAWVNADGPNTLTITAILLPGRTLSLFVLDYFEAAYNRYYEPGQELVQATDGGNTWLSAAHFDDPLVFDITSPHEPILIADDEGRIPPGTVWQATEGARWAMREQSGVVAVSPQVGGSGGWMRDVGNAVDYLVIAPRAFAAPAQALADYRAGLGLRSAVAIYEDVCDQFAGGLNTPEAIRSLLSFSHGHWTAPPWMVVLAGRGHVDYLGVTTTEANPLPAMVAGTPGGLRPVDGQLADLLHDDGVPDVAVGRIPARTEEQLAVYVAKLQAYEAAGPQPAHDRALFVADNLDDGGNFTATNMDLAKGAAARYEISHSSLDTQGVAAVRADVQNAFTGGSGIIHYTGHGAMGSLAAENVLVVGDVNALVHDSIPLLLSLTCLIGRFDHPTQVSLGEALVLRQGGGTVAVFAPSGLSWNYYAQQFGEEFYRLHAGELPTTLGPLLVQARQTFGALQGVFADSLQTYNLLGDPALKLRGGEGVVPPAWVRSAAHWRWERFGYADLADASVSGSIADGWKVPQRIVFSPVDDPVTPGTQVLLSAQADSGLDIVYQVVSGDATVLADGRTLLISPQALTSIRVLATQPGDSMYAEAQPVSAVIRIRRGTLFRF